MLRTYLLQSYYCSSQILRPVTQSCLHIRLSYPTCNNKLYITRYFADKPKDINSERIYYGPLTPQIKAVKVFSLSSSVAGLLAQPIIIREASSLGSTSMIIALCSIVGFFTFVTPLLLHFITKKYVTEMHYSPDKDLYTATTINFFMLPKKLTFEVENVEVPDIPGMFTSFKVKGKPLFVEATHFTDPTYYAKLMGYDKPLDFKLGDIEGNDEKELKEKAGQ